MVDRSTAPGLALGSAVTVVGGSFITVGGFEVGAESPVHPFDNGWIRSGVALVVLGLLVVVVTLAWPHLPRRMPTVQVTARPPEPPRYSQVERIIKDHITKGVLLAGRIGNDLTPAVLHELTHDVDQWERAAAADLERCGASYRAPFGDDQVNQNFMAGRPHTDEWLHGYVVAKTNRLRSMIGEPLVYRPGDARP